MDKHKYYELVEQLCKTLGISNSYLGDGICLVRIDEITLILAQGDGLDEDSLCIDCDFGVPIAEVKGLVLQRVMEANLYTTRNDAPTFGFNADTGHVYMMNRISLEETTLESLIVVLGNIAAYVHKWRDNLFVTGSELAHLPANKFESTGVH